MKMLKQIYGSISMAFKRLTEILQSSSPRADSIMIDKGGKLWIGRNVLAEMLIKRLADGSYESCQYAQIYIDEDEMLVGITFSERNTVKSISKRNGDKKVSSLGDNGIYIPAGQIWTYFGIKGKELMASKKFTVQDHTVNKLKNMLIFPIGDYIEHVKRTRDTTEA